MPGFPGGPAPHAGPQRTLIEAYDHHDAITTAVSMLST